MYLIKRHAFFYFNVTPSVVIESLTGKDYDSSGRSDWNSRMMNDGNEDNDDKPGRSDTYLFQ